MSELTSLIIHYADICTDIYAACIYNSSTYGFINLVYCIIFLLFPFFLYLIGFMFSGKEMKEKSKFSFSFFYGDKTDPVTATLPGCVLPFLFLTGIYPLYDAGLRFINPTRFAPKDKPMNSGRISSKCIGIFCSNMPQAVLQLYILLSTFMTMPETNIEFFLF